MLARADVAERIPQLGGMARPNGVVIVSERFWAFAGVDGSLREGEMASRPRCPRQDPARSRSGKARRRSVAGVPPARGDTAA